jgi:hypothetical protein
LQATEIGMLPAHWRTVTLGNVIDKGPQKWHLQTGFSVWTRHIHSAD